METEVKTDEYGRMYIPLPDEAREAITLEFLKEDYKVLLHFYDSTVEKLEKDPESTPAKIDFEDESRIKEAFETLIDYYGGSFNE